MIRAVAGLLVALLLAGCTPVAPRPFVSPLAAPAAAPRVLLPLTLGHVYKLGMAGCPASCDAFGCTWCYSWSTAPGRLPNVETVAMVWDETHLCDPVDASSRYVMGFNEPDWGAQADMAPDLAAGVWQALERRFPDKLLVSPVVTVYGLGWWRAWLSAFETQTGRRPRLAALAVHANLPSQDAIAWVTWWLLEAKRLNVPEVWVTETAQWSREDAHAFMAWAGAQPQITRIAPFVSHLDCIAEAAYWDCWRDGDPSLLDAAGRLTAKGVWYATPEERLP